MPSTAKEFRERTRKTVTLPSGLTVDIRKVWLIDFFTLGELPLPSPEEDQKAEGPAPKNALLSRIELDKYATRAVLMGAIDPVFVESEEDARGSTGSPQTVWIKDLSYDDFQALAEAILLFSGLTKEAAADADRFRPDNFGNNGKGAGAGVREAASGDHADGSGGVLPEPGSDLPGDREKEKAH